MPVNAAGTAARPLIESLEPRPRNDLGAASKLAIHLGGMLVGRRMSEAYLDMEEAQWRPTPELLQRSEDRLKPLLAHAVDEVPFYRESLGPDIRRLIELSPREALHRFPVLDKTAYRAQPDPAWYADGIRDFRRVTRTTSGSTGQPFAFALDRSAFPVIFASHLFYDSWFGLRPFDRYVRIVSPPAPVGAPAGSAPPAFRARQWITRQVQSIYEKHTQLKLLVWEIDEAGAESIWKRIERFRPSFVLGYTSALAAVAATLSARGRRLSHAVRGVITIAEPLTPERKAIIQEYFRAPIINRYGLRELGSWCAQACWVSPDRFHVNTELVICEILRDDGSPAAPGELGRVVLTDLHNFARPFIRYDTGDLAVFTAEKCRCGRGFPLLGEFQGRSRECFVTPSGRLISPTVLGHFLFVYHRHHESIREYQLVEEAQGRARLLIVPTSEWTAQQSERLANHLEALIGADVELVIEPVAEIPLERSGKRPIIKSRGSHGYAMSSTVFLPENAQSTGVAA